MPRSVGEFCIKLCALIKSPILYDLAKLNDRPKVVFLKSVFVLAIGDVREVPTSNAYIVACNEFLHVKHCFESVIDIIGWNEPDYPVRARLDSTSDLT